MPAFTPPVRYAVNNHMQERPFKFYRHAVSMNVVYRNAHYQEVRVADPKELANLTEGETWFPGGRTHVVDNATAALLEADGFKVAAPLYGEGAYGRGPYGG